MSRMTYAQQANGSSNKDTGSTPGTSSNFSSSNNNNNNNNSNSDHSKKEEFRRYLEQAGVLDALTKVLVGLYEEPDRPSQAVDYVRRYMGAPSNVDVEGLKRENAQLKAELEQLKRQMAMNHNQSSGGNAGGTASAGGGGGNTAVNGPKSGKKGNGSS